jgi:peroxin-6
LISYIADEVGFNVITVCSLPPCSQHDRLTAQLNCYDIVGESHAVTEGSLSAHLDKAVSASPCILLLDHIDALAKRSESSATGKTPAILKVLEDLMSRSHEETVRTGWPIVFVGTVVDEDSVPGDLSALFKQEITLGVSICVIGRRLHRLTFT